MPDQRDKSTIEQLLGTGSLAARLLAAVDWRNHPLGPPGQWPQSLRLYLQNLVASPESSFIGWGEQRIFFFNDKHREMLGSRIEEGMAKPFAEVWPEVFPHIAYLYQDAYTGKASRTVDMRIPGGPWGDESDRWWTFSFAPLFTDDGTIGGVQCVATDTTENVLRVMAERRAVIALETSERRLRRAQEAGQIGIFAIDISTNMLNGTPEVYRMFGLTEIATIPATVIEDLVIAEDDDLISRDESRRTGQVALNVEYRIRRADTGEIRWIERRGEFELDEQGRPTRLIGVVQDVTERQRARAELAELNATLEARVKERTAERNLLARIVEETDSLVYAIDHDYRWLAFNQAGIDEFDKVFDVRPRIGESIHVTLANHPDQLAEMLRVWKRALAGEEFTSLSEYIDPRRGGDVRTFEVKLNALRDDDGVPIGACQMITEITERVRSEAAYRQMQETLRQSQKMEAMGQLTGGVAHDFNNLLTPILGSLDLIQRRGNLTEREARLIDGALQSAERARILVQRLLAFARRQPLHPGPVDVGQLIAGMAELVGSTSGPTIQVVTEIPKGLPTAIADVNQLEMAILNLCVNARDAMPDGGTITISIQSEELPAGTVMGLPAGSYVRLSVTDVGSGMDEETRRRAVEPFYSTKGVGKGTGLGLSMVDGLVSQLGGTMSITSALGLGTRIDLWLPATDGLAIPPDVRSEDTQPVHFRGRALVVDDEPLVRMTTADMLQGLGYQTEEVEGAHAAKGLIDRGFRFDLVVTDHLMPGMSGMELAAAIRAEWPDLPVLIVSGHSEDGASGHEFPRLIKPFREADLARAISEICLS